MGTFAGIYKADEARIQDDKKEEFKVNAQRLFAAAGLMKIDFSSLYGKQVPMLRQSSPDANGNIEVFTSIYEDTNWEDAGYSEKRGGIYSGKIGWEQYNIAVLAAYMLEALYTDGSAAPKVNGNPVLSRALVSWINGVLGTSFLPKNHDPWALYEFFHYHRFEDDDYPDIKIRLLDWTDEAMNCRDIESFIGICAVEKGVPEVIAQLDAEADKRDDDGKVHADTIAVNAYREIQRFRDSNSQTEDEQIEMIICLLREYLHCDDVKNALDEKWDEKGLSKTNFYLAMTGGIQFAAAMVADVYGKDFWEFWDQIRDDATGCKIKSIFEIGGETSAEMLPEVSTEELFKVDNDRLIANWRPGSDIHFSDWMKESLGKIRRRFDELMKNGEEIDGGIRWIYELMLRACKKYFRIFAFGEFFEETLEHLTDRRYLAAWKIYEEMVDDPRMREAGSVIFSDKKYAGDFWGDRCDADPDFELNENWIFMGEEKKFNKARVILQGYMSLLYNHELRERVLGF